MNDFKEGDIFRWKFADERVNQCVNVYWDNSKIAIFKNSILCDTFWFSYHNEPSSDSKILSLDELYKYDLTFIANFSDLRKIDEHEIKYYFNEDVVNLNHANSSRNNIYVFKTANKSIDLIKLMFLQRKYDIESKIAKLQYDLSEINAHLEDINQDLIDNVHHLLNVNDMYYNKPPKGFKFITYKDSEYVYFKENGEYVILNPKGFCGDEADELCNLLNINDSLICKSMNIMLS